MQLENAEINCFKVFIVALCILKIHWVLYTNKCTNCI